MATPPRKQAVEVGGVHLDARQDDLLLNTARITERSVSPDTPTFVATEQIVSHCELYCPTCSNTSATARSRTSRETFDRRAMIYILHSSVEPPSECV